MKKIFIIFFLLIFQLEAFANLSFSIYTINNTDTLGCEKSIYQNNNNYQDNNLKIIYRINNQSNIPTKLYRTNTIDNVYFMKDGYAGIYVQITDETGSIVKPARPYSVHPPEPDSLLDDIENTKPEDIDDSSEFDINMLKKLTNLEYLEELGRLKEKNNFKTINPQKDILGIINLENLCKKPGKYKIKLFYKVSDEYLNWINVSEKNIFKRIIESNELELLIIKQC